MSIVNNYNAVHCLRNPHKRHHIAIEIYGGLLSIQTDLYILPALRKCCMYTYHAILDRDIMAPYCVAQDTRDLSVQTSLQWRHNGCDRVSNHQAHDCLLNRLFGRRSKKTSKLHVTGLCVGNSPGTGEFPAQMASNAENVSIWWRHHGCWCTVRSQFLLCSCEIFLNTNILNIRKNWHYDDSRSLLGQELLITDWWAVRSWDVVKFWSISFG